MPAILFGSISTIADTSELQRKAYNDAFAEHGLDWQWDRDTYRTLLRDSGGEQRVAEQARQSGEDVDAAAVHATKSRLFQQALAAAPLPVRPGVVDTIAAAKRDGLQVGLVTTTSPENVEALLAAVSAEIAPTDFDVVVDATTVEKPKPDGAAYAYALTTLGLAADAAIAVEDNVGGVQAANDAGVTVVAFPNENTAAHDFASAAARVDRLDGAGLRELIPAA